MTPGTTNRRESTDHVDQRAERPESYELIKAATSDRVANNVMSMLPPVGWADVATKSDLDSVRTEMRSEFSAVRSDVRALEANLRTEMHRSIRAQTWALVAWTTGLAGLIVALGR
ncbi:MAG: hypothetical protein RLN74_15720 [Ilumatobacter fluminis]|uniref:hypothetical protein n=1 Tax=Ilumatobacter fluminis TaxID=467091 RepID=UPI0032F09BF0